MSIFIIEGNYYYSVLRKGASKPIENSGHVALIIITEEVELPEDLKKSRSGLHLKGDFTKSESSIKEIIWGQNTWSSDSSATLEITSIDEVSCEKMSQEELEEYLRE